MIHEIIEKVSWESGIECVRELISQQATSSAGSFDLPFKFSFDRLSLAVFTSCGFIGGLCRTIPLLLVTRWIAVLYTHTYIYILGLPTPKKYQSFCTIRRFIKFMVVWSVSPKRLGVVCHGCVSHRHGPPPSLLTSILLSIHTSKLVSV